MLRHLGRWPSQVLWKMMCARKREVEEGEAIDLYPLSAAEAAKLGAGELFLSLTS